MRANFFTHPTMTPPLCWIFRSLALDWTEPCRLDHRERMN